MSRLISCFTNSYGRFGPEACFERVRSAGIDHVELAIKTTGARSVFGEEPILTDRSTPADLQRVRRLLDQHGVSLSSCNISSGNPLRAELVEITERKLQLAAELGVSLVVAGAGEAEDAQELSALFDNLRRIGDAAAEQGIVYCFETHPGVCQHARGMADTMQQLDHPALRLNFDTGNILYYNDGAQLLNELTAVRQWVRHVHLKDHNGRTGDWHFPAFGDGGGVDFSGIREALDEVGFTGPYSLEIEGIEGEVPLTLNEHHQRVARSVEHLRRCGF